MRWNHAGIKTADLDRSLHFYCDILGFRKLEEVEVLLFHFVGNDGEDWNRAVRADGHPADMREHRPLSSLFTVEDIAATAADLEEKGVSSRPRNSGRPKIASSGTRTE